MYRRKRLGRGSRSMPAPSSIVRVGAAPIPGLLVGTRLSWISLVIVSDRLRAAKAGVSSTSTPAAKLFHGVTATASDDTYRISSIAWYRYRSRAPAARIARPSDTRPAARKARHRIILLDRISSREGTAVMPRRYDGHADRRRR